MKSKHIGIFAVWGWDLSLSDTSYLHLAFKKNKKEDYKGYSKAIILVIFRCVP